MKKKVVLFDFDGTIADTVDAGVTIFNELAGKHGFLEITDKNTQVLREKGAREVMKELAIPFFRAPLVLRRLRRGIKQRLPDLKTIDNIKIVLLTLKQRGYVLGIVTSNSKENVLAFLKKNGLDMFDHIQAGTGLFRKSFAIRRTIFFNRFKKGEVIFVGDEIRDVLAARKNKIHAIAVTWGTNSREGLLRAGPDFIIDSAEELLDILI